MKKKLRKELNKLLPEGIEVAKTPLLSIEESGIYNERRHLFFDVEKHPTKEQLLEKAKRDYFDGVIFELFYTDQYKNVSSGNLKWSKNIHGKGIIDSKSGVFVYHENEGFAKIIKKPIIKVEKTWLYEGDEWFDIDTEMNFKLSCNKIEKGITEICFIDTIKPFLTKESALNYVLKEAKERFKGYKYFRLIGSKKRYTTDNYISWHIDNDSISNGVFVCWREKDGWLAEPIKEDKLMLGSEEVEILTYKKVIPGHPEHTNDDWTVDKTIIKCKGESVTKEEWIRWYNKILFAYENNFRSATIDLAARKTKLLKNGKINIYGLLDIYNITFSQIELITKALNEL